MNATLAYLTPSSFTTYIISFPLTLPRFNFHLKHTLIRTALKNGSACSPMPAPWTVRQTQSWQKQDLRKLTREQDGERSGSECAERRAESVCVVGQVLS